MEGKRPVNSFSETQSVQRRMISRSFKASQPERVELRAESSFEDMLGILL
jgi:hypothetical protein